MTTGLVFPQLRRPHAEHETLRPGLASAMFIASEISRDRGISWITVYIFP